MYIHMMHGFSSSLYVVVTFTVKLVAGMAMNNILETIVIYV